MELVKVQKRYQITLPKSLREDFDLEEGDYVALERKDGAISLVPVSVIPKDQRYFYTKEWQTGEAKADKDTENGEYIGDFTNTKDAIDSFRKAAEKIKTKK